MDIRRRDLEFEVDDMVFLKVASWKGVIRFQQRGLAQGISVRLESLRGLDRSVSFGVTFRVESDS